MESWCMHVGLHLGMMWSEDYVYAGNVCSAAAHMFNQHRKELDLCGGRLGHRWCRQSWFLVAHVFPACPDQYHCVSPQIISPNIYFTDYLFFIISVCMFRHFKKLSFLIKVTMYIILSYLSSLQILFYYHWVSLDCWDVCLNYSYSVVHFSLIIFLFHFLSDSAIVS